LVSRGATTAASRTDRAIADRLGIAEATLAKHLENAFAKLSVHSRTEALGTILAPGATAPDPSDVA
jgi:DNA-binding CsgD family transcriptional regulator